MTDRTACGLLLATDMDRTLLPNGHAPESALARPLFKKLAERPNVQLVYVTGRHLDLILRAITDYELPLPDLLISDVGTIIWELTSKTKAEVSYIPWADWEQEIGPDWQGFTFQTLQSLFEDLGELTLQDLSRQNLYKLSYLFTPGIDIHALETRMQARLREHKIKANLIWSVDETRNEGLLDILPASANKLHALEFMRERLGYQRKDVLFAGDSGNDLEVLTSSLPAVLVANATEEVRFEALETAEQLDNEAALYCAKGGVIDDLNGNYAAGILEGVAHFHPEFIDLLSS